MKKHFTKTSLKELLLVIAILIGLVIFDNTANPSGILYQIIRILCAVFVYFLVIKVRLHFLISTDFNAEAISPKWIVKELKSEMQNGKYIYSASEVSAILQAETLIENSKHQKAVRREYAERIAIALIITAMFVLGVL
jgi:hypothetical protein